MLRIFLLSLVLLLAIDYGQSRILDHHIKDKELNPIIILPGLMGSQQEAKLDKPSTVNPRCAKKKDWFQIWVNLGKLLPWEIDCFIDNMRLEYDVKSRHVQNSPGVQIRPVKFGATDGIEFLNSIKFRPLGYMNKMIDKLVHIGYKRNVSVRGAPYDWRRSPYDNAQFVQDLKKLVEDTVAMNGNRPAIIMGHSMGTVMSLYFLNMMTDAWKAKYVKTWMPISPVFGGSYSASIALAVGIDFGNLGKGVRSFSSLYFLLPTPQVLISTPFMTINGKDYMPNQNDYNEFFKMIEYTNGTYMYEDSKDLVSHMTHPGVDTICIYSKGIPTPEKMNFPIRAQFPDLPEIEFGEGDSVVNYASLKACNVWSRDKKFKFESKEFEYVNHVDTVKNDAVLQYIFEKIMN